jgi:chemotaxis protein CheX
MDPTYIKPFVSSIQHVFATMLQLNVTVKEPYLKADTAKSHDVSGIIGMTGDVVGTVVLAFPQSTAQNLVNLFTGGQVEYGTPDFADAVGELVNMVTGNAKALFKDKKASISCPSVVIGGNHRVANQSAVPCVVIPCSTECGDVLIEIALRPASGITVSSTSITTPAAA